jgi:hypothetical protein
MRGLRSFALLLALESPAVLTTGCAALLPTAGDPPEHRTADGLVLVEDYRQGALFVKPDHHITRHHRYHLSQVLLTYDRDSNHFTSGQEERIRQYFENATIGSMIESGSTMVTGPGRCVLSMGVGLVDIDLVEPDGTGASTSVLSTWGGVTLVVDIRDSVTGEPLLRFGRRRGFPGGIQWQDEVPPWREVRATLDQLVLDQRHTLYDAVPESTVADTSCLPPDPEAPETARVH